MRVSELWLREWINPAVSGQKICDQLTMAGLEVEARYPVAGFFDHVVVGKVHKTFPHPDADRLTICHITTAEHDSRQIVCGATNIRAGLLVAVALPGAQLPNGVQIRETKLRGQLSQGMVCSAAELGLEEVTDGILELSADAPVGANFREYLQLDDEIFELNLTPNRADCFSVLGIAREVAVLNGARLKPYQYPQVKPTISETRSVVVHDSVACPQYYGRMIRGINPTATTPVWLKERLRRSGLRAVHPVVDITNYVMLELGQPMHAFDLQQLDGDLHVRWNKLQEAITLLNGQEVVFTSKTLLIADEHKALGIAGVMGGLNSSVNKDSTDIFLESAFFNPENIAGVARRYGLSSESAMRFERGVDPKIQQVALERASKLLLDIVGGQAGPLTAFDAGPIPDKSIMFRPSMVEKLTGVSLPLSDMRAMLEGLSCHVASATTGHWLVEVPSHRFDLVGEVDLIEEITRLYGYHNIEAQPYSANIQRGHHHASERIADNIAQFLCANGYHETVSYSFVDPELQTVLYPGKHALSLLNPISSELSEMRLGLWPGLLASMLHNMHRQQTKIQLFEMGVIFEKIDNEVIERPAIAGLLVGETGAMSWNEPTRSYDFYDMAGDLQSLFHSLFARKVTFVKDQHSALHPGKSARLCFEDKRMGWVGVLHPKIASALDVGSEVMVFELYIDALPTAMKVQYQAISKYPQIRRDLSLLVDERATAHDIERVVRQALELNLLKDFSVFDVYTGAGIPAGKKSIAIALTLQNENRTLTDSEINVTMDIIIAQLDKELSIKIRE